MHYICAGLRTAPAGSLLRLSSHDARSAQVDPIGHSCAREEQCAIVAYALHHMQVVTSDSA